MLKALVLRKRMDDAKKEIDAIRSRLQKREELKSEIESSIAEAETDEEREAVEAAVSEFESGESEAIADAKKEAELSESVSEMERELEELENKNDGEPEAPAEESRDSAIKNHFSEEKKMKFRTRQIERMTAEARSAFVENEEVRSFIDNFKSAIVEKRAITGGSLVFPTLVVDMLREVVSEKSKLYDYVNVVKVKGNAREIIPAGIPEAVWTELCGNLNELTIGLNDVEVDGYKVGGFIPVCNALLDDEDVGLVDYLIYALGAAIAIALDKAILYGTGSKMPLGIVARLAQTSQPSGYPASARAWVDLSTSHVITIPSTDHGVEFFADLAAGFGEAKSKYSDGVKFWAMTEKTYNTMILVEVLRANANGNAIVLADGKMPVIGGDIVILGDEVIADGDIVAGYGKLYLLAERSETKLAQSEHAMFVNDKTVFKGTARYDGIPAIAEGFVTFGIGSAPATSATFAPDSANP